MTLRRPVTCLDDELSEYAAGRLDDARAREWERHLVACQLCCHTVRQEQRLREALAGAPSMPGDLRITLLALGREMEPSGPRPAATAPEPLALLAPSARACHRSPLRATVVAAAAAGVSAAAAWSLTVTGAPVVPRTGVAGTTAPVVLPAAGGARPGSPASGTAMLSVRWTTGPSEPTGPGRQAQSTP